MMDVQEYSELFKCLSEPVRLRLLNMLFHRGELCVCDLVDALGLSQSVVSRHLAYLRHHSLVQTRREGVWVYYQLNRKQAFASALLELLATDTKQSKALQADIEALKTSAGCC